MAFRHPVDIANRALQYLGSDQISETTGFTEDSKNAAVMGFAYDKLRRSELRANLWKFSTRKAVIRPISGTTMTIAPAMWASTTTYRPGAIVSDAGNTLWISNYPDNLNNAPGSSYFWELYTGPIAVSPWDSDTAYYAGELAFKYPGDGTAKVYFSLEGANEEDPATGTAWDATVTYLKNMVVTYLATPYISLIDLNLNQTPSATPAAWSAATTYAIGNQVYATDGFIYTSLTNGNLNNNPISSPTHWTNTGILKPWTDVFTGGTGSKKWLEITPIALTRLFAQFPLGSGPSTSETTRNAFRLPANFLRMAPQDPKAGSNSVLGGPSGLPYTDWNVEGDFIVTSQVDPMVLRFIADIQDVSGMDDLFCEALASRMALGGCETLTQSTAKKQMIASEYNKFVNEARRTNAIEVGAIEPPEDDFLTCRR